MTAPNIELRDEIHGLFNEGLRQADVARELGISPQLVWHHLHRPVKWRAKHVTVAVDEERRVGLCSSCGEVPMLRKLHRNMRRYYWRCRNAERDDGDRRQRPYRFLLKERCERCGFEPVHPCELHGHHRDGRHANNEAGNIETLCANCHALVHSGFAHTDWHSTRGRPKSRALDAPLGSAATVVPLADRRAAERSQRTPERPSAEKASGQLAFDLAA
ncbi:MAG: hypothetical protein ACRDLA_11870 [Thermoleophilaceae bacterium]